MPNIKATFIWTLGMEKVFISGLMGRSMKGSGIKGYSMAKQYWLLLVNRIFILDGIEASLLKSILMNILGKMISILSILVYFRSCRNIILNTCLLMKASLIILKLLALFSSFSKWIVTIKMMVMNKL